MIAMAEPRAETRVCALLVLSPCDDPGRWRVTRLTPRNGPGIPPGRGWRPGINAPELRALSLPSAIHRVCSAWSAAGYACEAMRTAADAAHITVRAGHA